MGFLDFLKKKELSKISSLNKELDASKEIIAYLENRVSSLSKYESVLKSDNEIQDLERKFDEQKRKFKEKQEEANNTLRDLDIMIERRKKLVIELDDKILIQDFNLYNPIYDLDSSDDYKEEIENTKYSQELMIKNGTAATCSTTWTVNGSLVRGAARTRDNIKQILRCFNDECDILISKVKFNNIDAFREKMKRSWKALNRMNKRNTISISEQYLELKIQELELAYEYAVKKQEEKEERRRIRERLREEAKLRKEIEEARQVLYKERRHYTNALIQINKRLDKCKDQEENQNLTKKKQDIESHISDLSIKIKDIDYRAANKKAGYVYIISNIGSFGEGVYKIGMTRRLEPMERVDELGDASVPFKFDVHAMIFSDDAPKLEAALHRAFMKNKVNVVNNRREFFRVSLDEIERVVKENYDKTVEFKRIPDAQQYRESLKVLENPDAYPELFKYKEYKEVYEDEDEAEDEDDYEEEEDGDSDIEDEDDYTQKEQEENKLDEI